MDKVDSIARKILGWKLNRWDRWYDYEKSHFISTSDFQPEENLDHAMLIVEKLQYFGFNFEKKSDSEVYFNEVMATGETLAQAITNAAYSLIEERTLHDTSDIWQKMC